MNLPKSIALLVLAILASRALPQQGGGKDVKPVPPEILAKYALANEAEKRGEELMRQKKFDEAIAAFREVVAIEETIPGFESSGNYALARAFVASARPEEALVAYKKALTWNPRTKELSANGPPFPYVQLDYAILLAKCGRAEEAQMVYYSVLRLFPGSRYSEPFPFLIVFDEDATMTVWEYSMERFVAAATMARATLSQGVARDLTNQVRELEPIWIFPVVFLASLSGNPTDFLATAESVAASDEERAWVRRYKDALAGVDEFYLAQRFGDVAEQLAAIGVARRKASAVLAQAKLDLERNWHKVASPMPGNAG